MSEAKEAKPESKKKQLNRAKYAVISAERAEKRLKEAYTKANDAYARSVKAVETAQKELDVLLAA